MKIGDKVICTEKSNERYGCTNAKNNTEGRIVGISSNGEYRVRIDKCDNKIQIDSEWSFKENEIRLVDSYFQVGDIVKINKQATIEDFTKDYWNGSQMCTLNFIEKYGSKDEEFEVIKVESENLTLKGICYKDDCYECVINKNIFELVKRKEVKEMTLSEVCKELGYEVKIKKED